VRVMSTTRIDPATLPGRDCPLASALELVGDRWALLAVREVMFGSHRFTEIARGTGAPTDRLSARLKDLVALGVLERRPCPQAAGREGYFLTEAGRDLTGAVRALMSWGERWAVTTTRHPVRHDGHAFVGRTVCETCGEAVTEDELIRTAAESATGVRPAGF
jgi:DNA-binding HxlR family transcriptional regulator